MITQQLHTHAVWDEITYPFPNLNGAAVDIQESVDVTYSPMRVTDLTIWVVMYVNQWDD